MFPKAKQEEQPKDPSVLKEANAENNGIQPIGNQGAQDIPPIDPGAGNDAMKAQILNQALNIINNQEQAPQGQPPKQDLYYDQMEQKPLFYQDPDEPEPLQGSVQNLDEIMDRMNEENPSNRT